LEIEGNSKVSGVRVENNALSGTNFSDLQAEPTGKTSKIETGLVFRSVGYRGLKLDGLPFDEAKGVVPNADGRVLDQENRVPGAYVVGWIKRGPRGVIGTNKKCARDTVLALLSDAKEGSFTQNALTADEVEQQLKARQPQLVSMKNWERIDHKERLDGDAQQRPRVKKTDWQSLLKTADLTLNKS
jgi:ferredoxin--NADP+ reductase